MSHIHEFQQVSPSNSSYWRSIILFGANAASYKFALGQALLELSKAGKTNITAEELAIPYVRHLCEHLKSNDRQCTSQGSKFLDACRQYNEQQISYEKLIGTTVKEGFNNVLDAFHNVSREEIGVRFFEKNGSGNRKGIVLTDNIHLLQESLYIDNLGLEIEARWNLVETAWDLSLPVASLMIQHDPQDNLFYITESKYPRKNLTAARDALNGYQKGKCFYCFSDISIAKTNLNCEVDHFIPHSLMQDYRFPYYLDGIWNLVLSCEKCNRGINGKFDRIPDMKYLERLNRRNNFLVNSHHPLGKTLQKQTGTTDAIRAKFLNQVFNEAISRVPGGWCPEDELEPIF